MKDVRYGIVLGQRRRKMKNNKIFWLKIFNICVLTIVVICIMMTWLQIDEINQTDKEYFFADCFGKGKDEIQCTEEWINR